MPLWSKTAILVVLVLSCKLPLYAASDDKSHTGDGVFEFVAPGTAPESSVEARNRFEDDPQVDSPGTAANEGADEKTPPWHVSLLRPARWTLKHAVFYKTTRPDGIKNNRSSLRLEYARPLGAHGFVQLDTTETLFWRNDHRAQAQDKETVAENFTREAFFQVSYADTSIKAGIQILIWGESEGGAITDVISPRDYSEAFFISLEASRIGQPMLLVDQFTPFGDLSAFFIPDPEFNKYPEDNTAYDVDVFNAPVHYREESAGATAYEYGGRWKKTFGQSDVALMAASLMENDEIYRLDGFGADGKMIITKRKERFTLAGLTFNYVRGRFLYKGEIAMKFPRHFNTDQLQIEKKDVLDTALGLDYSPGGAYTLSLELVNRHIMDWDRNLAGVRENDSQVILSWQKNFFNETLSVFWMSIYMTPAEGYLHTLRTTYQWNDHLSLKFEAFYPDIADRENSLWVYHDQKQVALKILYQF